MSETVVDRPVDVLSSKLMVAGLRMALVVSNLPNEIDTDRVHNILAESNSKVPSPLQIGKAAFSEDAKCSGKRSGSSPR